MSKAIPYSSKKWVPTNIISRGKNTVNKFHVRGIHPPKSKRQKKSYWRYKKLPTLISTGLMRYYLQWYLQACWVITYSDIARPHGLTVDIDLHSLIRSSKWTPWLLTHSPIGTPKPSMIFWTKWTSLRAIFPQTNKGTAGRDHGMSMVRMDHFVNDHLHVNWRPNGSIIQTSGG